MSDQTVNLLWAGSVALPRLQKEEDAIERDHLKHRLLTELRFAELAQLLASEREAGVARLEA